MNDNEDIGEDPKDPTTAESVSLLKFPTEFPLKIMGKRDDGFGAAMTAVVLQFAPDFDPATLETRVSKDGNYQSVTATINATSRVQLDDLYKALTAHPMVKIVL